MRGELRIRRGVQRGGAFGRRRGMNPWFLGFWLLVMAFMAFVVWQFNAIQPTVLAAVGAPPTPTPNPAELARRADAAFWRGDLESAITSYRQAAQGAPRDVGILFELSRNLIYRSYGDVRFSKDIDEAARWAAQAVETGPNNARAYAINCFALLRAEKYEDALRSCIRSLDLNPNDGEARAYLSMADYGLGRTAQALEEGRMAVEAKPDSIDAHTAYAFALWYQGRLSTALEHFKQAAAINPRLEFPYFNMGGFANAIAVNDKSRYLVAIAAYNQVLAMNKNSVKAYTRLCATYLARRDEDDTRLARFNCETATELDTDFTPAWRWLGQVFYASRNYEGAVEAFEQCADREIQQGISIKDRQEECWYLQGLAYFILAECDKARPIFEEILKWADEEITIRETRKGIEKCLYAYQGQYKTPTPVPTPTPRPTPIL